ncbi:hypothetical protein [Empedobacter sedimenti]|uniref:hypothetical protein n=1 Tax=Empedobacter sedimenti TaxID=3042610 RepID=UPI0024A62DCC|nr:hypothetical protein [Empedobacter sedimenti]
MILKQTKDSIYKEQYNDFYKKGGCVEFVVFENFEVADAYTKHLEVAKNVLIQNCTDWEKDFINLDAEDEKSLEKIYPSYFDLAILKPSGKQISVTEFFGPYYDFQKNKVLLRGVQHFLNSVFVYDDPEGMGYHINDQELRKTRGYQSSEYISCGFCDAFLDPPHSLGIGKTIKERGQYFMDFIESFFLDIHQLEIYSWSVDSSDYFEMGKEWWGSFFWTVYNPVKNIYIGIIASTTD